MRRSIPLAYAGGNVLVRLNVGEPEVATAAGGILAARNSPAPGQLVQRIGRNAEALGGRPGRECRRGQGDVNASVGGEVDAEGGEGAERCRQCANEVVRSGNQLAGIGSGSVGGMLPPVAPPPGAMHSSSTPAPSTKARRTATPATDAARPSGTPLLPCN